MAKSKKEKIFDGLTSVFKHERIWAVKETLQVEHVDEEIFQRLEALALRDNEPEVREAATEIISQLRFDEEGQ